MKVLFVVPDLFFSDPLGVMQLSAICKQAGHETRLAALKRGSIREVLDEFVPDLIGYSVMTPDAYLFKQADEIVRSWSAETKKNVSRIMGGPHPTYFPEVLGKLNLDAICVGDGENAILAILEAIQSGKDLSGIPNVATQLQPEFEKEVVEDMDSLPFADRKLIYDCDPDLQNVGLRSFLTQKGCPYLCTYCFNHAYNLMFKGSGVKLLRRRSVDHLISEIKDVVKYYPTVKMLRFADDVFVIRRDAWLEEFADKFPKEVGLPFYCLIRSNSLTEDVAQLLAKAGCCSIGMSIEAGDPKIRNVILKRNMTDEMVEESLRIAKKYKINSYSNTMLGVPGTTLEDDFNSFMFSKKLKPAGPTFGVFCPFPGTDLTDYAIEIGVLDKNFDFDSISCFNKTILNNYTEEEKNIQANLAHLAPLFVHLPNFMIPLLKKLIRINLPKLYSFIGAMTTTYILSSRIFPNAQPTKLSMILKSIFRGAKFFSLSERTSIITKKNLRFNSQTRSDPSSV